MKKSLYSLVAILVLCTASFLVAEDKIDPKTEFKYEQEVCVTALVNAWLSEKPDKELTSLFGNMVRANSRYRMVSGGVDNSLAGNMVRATETGKTVKEKLSLAICEYFRSKGINLETRANFNRGSFKVRN